MSYNSVMVMFVSSSNHFNGNAGGIVQCDIQLNFTTLLANSVDGKVENFSQKKDLTFHANCLHWRQLTPPSEGYNHTHA